MTSNLDIYRSAQILVKRHGQVALIEHGVGPHGGMDRRVGAVVLHEHVGRAVYVEVGGHSCRTKLTAASASEAVMSGRTRWTAWTASSVWPR